MRQVNRFADDVLNFVGNVRARTANEIMRGFRDVQRKEAALTLPILAMHGTADKITSYTVRGPAQLSRGGQFSSPVAIVLSGANLLVGRTGPSTYLWV